MQQPSPAAHLTLFTFCHSHIYIHSMEKWLLIHVDSGEVGKIYYFPSHVPLMVIWYTCHVFAWQPGLLQSKRTQCFHRDQRVTGWCFGSFWTISWSTDLDIFLIKASKKWFAKFFQITITQTCMAYDNTSCVLRSVCWTVGPRRISLFQVLNHASGPGEDDVPTFVAPAPVPQAEKEDVPRWI